jgi:hypothetical protein
MLSVGSHRKKVLGCSAQRIKLKNSVQILQIRIYTIALTLRYWPLSSHSLPPFQISLANPHPSSSPNSADKITARCRTEILTASFLLLLHEWSLYLGWPFPLPQLQKSWLYCHTFPLRTDYTICSTSKHLWIQCDIRQEITWLNIFKSYLSPPPKRMQIEVDHDNQPHHSICCNSVL